MEIKTEDFDDMNSNNKFALKIKTEVFSESEDSNKAEDFEETNNQFAKEIKEEVFSELEDSDEGEDFNEVEDSDETNSNKSFTMEIKEEDYDETIVALDTYNSDLNLVIDAARFSAKPLTNAGFGFMWAGARATHGASQGRFCFEVKILQHLIVQVPKNERNPHLVRVGFSVESSTIQLGEDPLSYGYDGAGNISTNCKFKEFDQPFKAGDVILAAVDFDSEVVQIGFAKNGKFLGWAFQVEEKELKGHSLFPHVLTKNVSFEVNLGQKEHPYFPLPDPLKDFTFIGCLPMPQRVGGTRPPKRREDCEVLMLCGLPGSGKSAWAANYSASNPDKKFNILGTTNILNKMKVMGLPDPRKSHGKWDYLLHRAELCLREMHKIGSKLKRNYILDENYVSPNAQSRGMRPFAGFRRKAVVVLPSEAEYNTRILKDQCYRQKLLREEGRRLPGKRIQGFYLLVMKANFKLPKVNRTFDEVIYAELQKKDAENLIVQYRERYNFKSTKRCKQRTRKELYKTLKQCLKGPNGERIVSPAVVIDIFNEVTNAELPNEDPRTYKGKAGVKRPEQRKFRNALERCLEANVKMSSLNIFIKKMANKQRKEDAKNISNQYNDKGNAAVEPPEKKFKLSDDSRFDSGQAFPNQSNFNGRNRKGKYRVGFKGYQGGFARSRGGFEWNRRGFDRSRGGFEGSRGALYWNRGGFDRNRAGCDWNREGSRGGFDMNRGGFNGSGGGFERDQERFDRNRAGCNWNREGGRGGFDMNWGGFNTSRRGYNIKRSWESDDNYGNSRYFNAGKHGGRYRERKWSAAEYSPETSSLGSAQVRTSYSSCAPQIKTEPADDASAYASSGYTTQVKAEPPDNGAQ